MTRLSHGQLTELSALVAAAIGDVVKPGGRAATFGLFRSVAMVAALMRRNFTQEVAAGIFGCSQATVSRRWDLVRPVIGQVLASCVPDPGEFLGDGTAVVDGTIAPTWEWKAVPDLYSGKAGYPGMNLQVAATLSGRVGTVAVDKVDGCLYQVSIACSLLEREVRREHPVCLLPVGSAAGQAAACITAAPPEITSSAGPS